MTKLTTLAIAALSTAFLFGCPKKAAEKKDEPAATKPVEAAKPTEAPKPDETAKPTDDKKPDEAAKPAEAKPDDKK